MLLAMGPVLGRMGASVLLLLSGASLLCWTFARVESVPTSMLAFVPSRIPKAFTMAAYGDSDSPWGVQSVLSGNASSLLRDNLRPDELYVTQWGMGLGMTNQFLGMLNLIYIGLLTTRVPVVPPFLANKHIAGDKLLPFGEVFDLTHLRAQLRVPVIDWRDIKPSNETHEEIHCWALHKAMPAAITASLGVNASYSELPKSAMGKKHHLLVALADLLYPSHMVTQQRQSLPGAYVQNPPDKHIACFDYLYFASSSGEHLDWDEGLSWPAWRMVGQHLRFAPKVMAMAREHLRVAMELPAFAEIPPFISVHMRRGDFGQWCKGVPENECFPAMPAYVRRVQEVKDDLASRGVHVEHVVVQSNERDPGFWQDLKALGYSFAEYTTEEQEGWWAIVLDACIQSLASGFVGTAHSTVSLISERRVQEWSGGPTRMVKWGKLGADDH
ncbi:hypothetical protein K523DRAFT_284615 [Schizophyllum commune Tattone D]|nr:hypothetical protein K523DRAFT_284615 [Schizophyllum commune Tattone D]